MKILACLGLPSKPPSVSPAEIRAIFLCPMIHPVIHQTGGLSGRAMLGTLAVYISMPIVLQQDVAIGQEAFGLRFCFRSTGVKCCIMAVRSKRWRGPAQNAKAETCVKYQKANLDYWKPLLKELRQMRRELMGSNRGSKRP